MVACHRVWWVLAAFIWVVGCSAAVATVAPSALGVIAVFVGLNAAGFSLAGALVSDRQAGRVRVALRHGLVAATATIAVLGLLTAFGGWGLLVCVLLGATCPPLADRFWRWREQRGLERREEQVPPARRLSDGPARSCSDMSTPELVYAWRASFNSLQRAPTTAAKNEIVIRRQQYLDELERRDPDGIRRWLDSGARAASDPTRFLRADDRRDPPSEAA